MVFPFTFRTLKVAPMVLFPGRGGGWWWLLVTMMLLGSGCIIVHSQLNLGIGVPRDATMDPINPSTINPFCPYHVIAIIPSHDGLNLNGLLI